MAENCGGIAATNQKQHISFITSNNVGNGILASRQTGQQSHSCIFPGTTTWEQVQQNVHSWVVSPSDLLAGNTTPSHYEHTQTVTVEKTVGGFTNNWATFPFYICMEADMEMFFRTVNGQNHLIVKLTNIFSTFIGSQDYNKDNCNKYNYIPGYGNPMAFRLAVSLTPTPNDSNWQNCFGGWWLEPMLGCTADCEGKLNPPGGYNYYWGCKQQDGAFARSPYPGRLNPGPYEWDLGAVGDTSKHIVYVSAQATESTNKANPCSGMYPKTGMVVANAYAIPPLNVCPPEFIGETQDRDICENCAITTLTMAGNDLLGTGQGTLYIEYVWGATLANVNWSQAEGAYFQIRQDRQETITLACLIGASHYAYRAKIILNTSYSAESEWTYGEFDTLYIPKPNMSVPAITEQECTEINNGNLVPPFEEDTKYGGNE